MKIKRMMSAEIQPNSIDGTIDSAEYLHLLVALVPQVERLAVLCGMCCAISKSLVERSDDVKARALIKFFPRDSSSIIIAASRLRRWHRSSRLTILTQDALNRVANAKQTTIEFAANGFGERAGSVPTLDNLSSTWTDSSAALLELLQYITKERSRLGISATDPTAEKLPGFLKMAITGRHQDLVGVGEISIPAWAEHRRSNRLSVRVPVRMFANGTMLRGVLRDMSCGGIGLDCVAGLSVGDRVIIEISGRNTVEGDVIWTESGRAGLSTECHIRSFLPILSFALRDKHSFEDRVLH